MISGKFLKKIIIISAAMFCMACITPLRLPAKESNSERQIRVVAAIYPVYDWVLNIIGDNPGNIKTDLLIKDGTDMHSFQPSVSDIMTISSCDMLIYVGGESDGWIDDAASQAINKDIVLVRLMDELGGAALEEDPADFISGNPAGHDNSGNEDHEETELDEHVWLSLKNAVTLCESIADALAETDPDNGEYYSSNAESYISRLRNLDSEYQRAVDQSEVKTLVVADRFPFRYLVEDYGLDYFAAFSGCSAETEASFETIIFLCDKVNELHLKNILVIDGSDERLARTIVQNTQSKDQNILMLDSMQSVTQSRIDEGAAYMGIMENNLEVLRSALSE